MSLWDEGDIGAAVTRAKDVGAIFIVFVKGENALSTHYEELFNKSIILQKLKSEKFVAVKVQENTLPHQQFSRIYPNNAIPSIYFIGKFGKPIEIIKEEMQENDFIEKIDSILAQHTAGNSQATSNLINEEKKAVSQNADLPSSSAGPSSSSDPVQPASEPMPEKKLQHAKELIEQQREEKRKKEEEEERQKEIERRKMGQNVQQLKKWQQDEELKQLKEERDKEKRENQAARDRVLAQIAQDKAERAARFSQQGPSNPPKPSQSAPTVSNVSPKSNTTKLQFRLPNGTLHAHEFRINDTLEVVHQYIQNEMNLPFTSYTLSTTFPRREFTTSDNSQTLLDLQLVPNAVVLILPQNQVAPSNPGGMVGNWFWWLLAPLFSVYGYFVGYFFGRPQTSVRTVESNTKRPATDDNSQRNVSKRQASESTVIKKQGNIHRLSDRPDSDDDNNTWNGNSTQQM